MSLFTLFVEYRPKGAATSALLVPELIEATNEWEASRVAGSKADKLWTEGAEYVLIRVIGEQEPGQPIAEIRRPLSN